jgi:hypothetical protein
MAETKEADESKPQFRIGKSADHMLIYADGVRIITGGYDMKFVFSTNEVGPDGKTYITEHLTLVLTPQHVKDLAEKMTEQAAKYEEDFMPLNFTEKYRERVAERRKILDASLKQDDSGEE